MNYNTLTNNNSAVQPNDNQFTAVKRKLDVEEEQKSAKRMHFIHNHNSATDILLLQHQNMPSITYASPDYKPNFRLSANATANMANTPSPMIEDTIMEDDFTDEDESLQTPSSMLCSEFIPHDIGQDLDQGGYTGSLELGWSEMFNDL